MRRFLWGLNVFIQVILLAGIGALVLSASVVSMSDPAERIGIYTRDIEFNYVDWSFQALAGKYVDFSAAAPRYMGVSQQRQVVTDYLKLVSKMDQTNDAIAQIYADPHVKDPVVQSADLTQQLAGLKEQRSHLQPLAEGVMQYQVGVILDEQGLSVGGQVLPPVLYHITSLPNALIISPREKIQQDQNISLIADITLQQITQVESGIEKSQNVSALVVPVGGVGIYPTMVMSTTDLPWLMDTVAHEWTHNYLTLRPLGVNYETTPQLRTMNETTADIVGREVGYYALQRFYPDVAAKVLPPASLLPPPAPTPPPSQPSAPQPQDPNAFNYNHEMHLTRVHVDELLAAKKTQEAEDYLEARRQFFWDHGYHIRRLNQAYFAFYGAYADNPGGGASGQDPVGPAVQALRRRSDSLAGFLNHIAAFSSYDQLAAETKP